MSLNQDTTPGFPSNLGGTVKKVDSSIIPDNVFTYSSAGEVWQRIFDGGNSVYRASWLFITGAPADKTALVNIALAASAIGTLEIDVPITLNGSVAAAGKTIVVQPGGLISGTGTIDNVVLSGDATQQLAATTLTFTNAKNATGKWLPTQFGATGDGVTDDYAAINFTNTVANANSQKIINLLPGTYNIGTNLAISSGVLLDFEHGAVINGAVTLSGSSAQYAAQPAQRIFGTSLTVSGIYPQSGATSPMNFGALGDDISDDQPPFQRMWDYFATSSAYTLNIYIPPKEYYFASSVTLPKTAVAVRMCKVDGNGCNFRSSGDYPIWQRTVDSDGEATTAINGYICHIKGIRVEGTSTVGTPLVNAQGFKIQAIYSWVFEDIISQGCYNGIAIYFGLGCKIYNFRAGGTSGAAILGRYGDWSGATRANSAFNSNEIKGCRVFNSTNSFTSLQLLAADQTIVDQFISEGNNPQYNFYFDSEAGTTINVNTFQNIWIESKSAGTYTTNTNFYIIGAGKVILKNIQRIYPNTLFFLSSTSANGTVLLIDTLPFEAGGGTPYFNRDGSNSTNFSIIFKGFKNLNIVADPANWDGGTVPSNASFDSEAQGQRQIRTNDFMQLISASGGISLQPNRYVGLKYPYNNNITTGIAFIGCGTAGTADLPSVFKSTNQTGLLYSESSRCEMVLTYFNNTNSITSRSAFVGKRARGSIASPLAVASGNALVAVRGEGYDGAALVQAASLEFGVDGTVSSGNVPTRFQMFLMPSGGAIQEVFGIRSTGALEIKISPPVGAVADTILVRNSTNGEVRGIATTSLVASGTQYQLAYYAANGSTVSGLTLISANFVVISNANGLPIASDIQVSSSKYGFGIAPTAKITLPAGTATANTAPLKLTPAGAVLLATPENGAVEAVESRLYYTDSTGVRFVIHAGGVATIAAGAGAGTGPTVSVSGTDEDGVITITTGTSTAASALVATVTFSAAFAVVPKVVILTPAGPNSAALTGAGAVYVDNTTITSTKFDLSVGGTPLTDATTYKFYYLVKQ